MSNVLTSLFQEPTFDHEENYAGFIIGGMAQTDDLSLARAYKMAADAVVAKALRSADLSYEYAYPALYLYRHTIELYLKLVVRPKEPNHGLMKLTRQFVALVRTKLKQKVPTWVTDRIRELSDIDPASFSFRYSRSKNGKRIYLPGESFVHYRHLRETVDVLVKGFEKAHFAMPNSKQDD